MNGVVVWLTGLPASGKSTLAARVRGALHADGRACCVLDGDEVREALSPTPGYGDEARDAFYRTLGQLAALLARQGLVVVVAATAHLQRYRDAARSAAPRFVEVHVATSLAECEARDDKGLYAGARRGGVASLPGMQVTYEVPDRADVVANGGNDEAAVERIIRATQ